MRDKNKSLIDTAAEIAESVLPEVQSVLAAAFNTAGAAPTADADTTISDTTPASADAAGTPEAADSSGGSRLRGLLAVLVIGGLIAVAAVVIKRILGDRSGEDAADNWTSSYTPTPPGGETEAPADVPADEAEADNEAEEADEPSTKGPSTQG
jgi:Alphaherpesvirus glycoprotein E